MEKIDLPRLSCDEIFYPMRGTVFNFGDGYKVLEEELLLDIARFFGVTLRDLLSVEAITAENRSFTPASRRNHRHRLYSNCQRERSAANSRQAGTFPPDNGNDKDRHPLHISLSFLAVP